MAATFGRMAPARSGRRVMTMSKMEMLKREDEMAVESVGVYYLGTIVATMSMPYASQEIAMFAEMPAEAVTVGLRRGCRYATNLYVYQQIRGDKQ